MRYRWWIGALVLGLWAGTASAREQSTFDVVSIKPVTSVRQRGLASTLQVRPGSVRAAGITAEALIGLAYPVNGVPRLPSWIIGGPDWLRSARFEFIATTHAGAQETSVREELPALLRGVMKERFNLRGHHEMRRVAIFALVRARHDRLGPLLRPTDPRSDPWIGSAREYISAIGMSMDTLASRLTSMNAAGRVVVDRTSLPGAFDLDLYWSPERTAATGAVPPDVDGPSLFTAVQEQLGLKLEARREPQEVFVIDHIDRPTEN